MNRQEIEQRLKDLAEGKEQSSRPQTREDLLALRVKARQEAYQRHMQMLYEGGADYAGNDGWRSMRRRNR